jgi:hypothetical protein
MGRRDDSYCQYCGDPLDAGSEFVFLVEAQVYDEEVAPLEHIQQSPHYHGEPLRVCKECRAGIEQNRQDLLEEAAVQEASARRFRKVLAVVGILALLFLLALILLDLQR